jgi:hypothetical protein
VGIDECVAVGDALWKFFLQRNVILVLYRHEVGDVMQNVTWCLPYIMPSIASTKPAL